MRRVMHIRDLNLKEREDPKRGKGEKFLESFSGPENLNSGTHSDEFRQAADFHSSRLEES